MMKPLASNSRRNGSVLVIVMWTALGLAAVALTFGHTARLDFQAAENRTAGLQAELAVESGLRYAIYLLENQETPGAVPDLPPPQAGPLPVGPARFWFIGRSQTQPSFEYPYFGIQDEAAKLDLNTATREMLEALPLMTAQLAGAIIDWRDEDEEPVEFGAESTVYLQGDPPYRAKNAPFDSIEELSLLFGAEPHLLLGEDGNRNGMLDPNENDGDLNWPPDNQDGILDPGILEYVTVHRPVSPAGGEESDRIDVNDNDEDPLEELLAETFGEERADELRIPNNNDNFDSLLEFYEFSRMTAEEFVQIEHRLYVGVEDEDEDEPATTRINVNTASEAVLACLPGFDPKIAAAVVAYRQNNEPGTATITWLSDIDSIDDETLEEALEEAAPYLTGTTSLYRIDLAAVGRHGKGYRRAQFVVETGETTTILSRLDLPQAGWALGEATRLELATWQRDW